MPPQILIDTDILIDVSRNIPQAKIVLTDIEKNSRPSISVITTMEILIGSRDKREQEKAIQFFNRFKVIELDQKISQYAFDLLLKYRLSHGLLIPDALIASTALVHGLPFISKNQADFRFIEPLDFTI